MKFLLKRFLARSGYTLHRLPHGVATGVELPRDLRLIVGARPHPCCIDAGANDGSFSTTLLGCLSSPRIHAFEPNPSIFARLRHNHAQTPGIRLNQAGLGAETGSLVLNLVENHALNSFLPLSTPGREKLDAHDAARMLTVPVLKLDDYAEREKLPGIDLLKIDTQGFELYVLQGAEALLTKRRVHTVLLELNFTDLYEGQASPIEMMAFLGAYGFRLVDFYEKCRHHVALDWCTALFAQPDKSPR